MKKAYWQIIISLGLILFLSSPTIAQRLGNVPGQYLVWMQDGQPVEVLINDYSFVNNTPTGIAIVKQLIPGYPIYLLSNNPQYFSESALLTILRNDSRVAMAQINHWLEKRSLTPDDPLFNQQWNFLNNSSGADIDIDLAWEITTGGQTPSGTDIVVAIIDDGIDPDHPDLAQNLWVNTNEIAGNGIDDDDNDYIDDFAGWNIFADFDQVQYGTHGIWVAGVLGAKGNNSIGITGTNWDLKILPIVGISGLESEIIEGYGYALKLRQDWNESNGDNGAFVTCINTSWGLDAEDPAEFPLWCEMFDLLGESGILSVTASTNSDSNVDIDGDMPSNCSSPYLISVTSTDENDLRNNTGYGVESVDIAAPGKDILTTDIVGGYTYKTGTSFASPQVAGVLALLYAVPCEQLELLTLADPEVAAQTVRDALFNGVDLLSNLQDEVATGGRLNAFKAIQELLDVCDNCLGPVGLEADVLTDSTAILNWVSLPGNDQVILNWREVGTFDWNVVANPIAPYLLEGLEGCKNYEFQLIGLCSGSDMALSYLKTFESLGCCTAPVNLIPEVITIEEALISWDVIYGVSYYQYRFRESGTSNWSVPMETFDNSVTISGLLPCHFYDFELRAKCFDEDFSPVTNIQIQTPECNDCTQYEYCQPSYLSIFEWIESFTIGGQTFETGNNEGYYQDFGSDITLGLDETHEFIVVPGFDFVEYDESYMIWIDIGIDGEFDYPEDLVYITNTSTDETLQDTFSLPIGAITGQTRLRVIQVWEDVIPFPEACNNFEEFGEVEDYCVTIVDQNVPPCQTIKDFIFSDISIESVTIDWAQNINANLYQLRYRKIGELDWTYVETPDSTMYLVDLEECTEYELQGNTQCTNGAGEFSESVLFHTECLIPNEEPLKQAINTLFVYPNPFQDALQITGLPGESYSLQLYAIDGRFIEEQVVSFGTTEGSNPKSILFQHHLAAGVYLLHWTAMEQHGVIRLVKM